MGVLQLQLAWPFIKIIKCSSSNDDHTLIEHLLYARHGTRSLAYIFFLFFIQILILLFLDLKMKKMCLLFVKGVMSHSAACEGQNGPGHALHEGRGQCGWPTGFASRNVLKSDN